MTPVASVPWHRSIRFRLVAAALLVQLLMLGVLLANSHRLVTSALSTQTQARLDALTPLLNAALAGRVFQRDHSEIQSVLDALVQSRSSELRYIEVFGPRGEQLARAGEAPNLAHVDTDIQTALTDLTYHQNIVLTLSGQTRVGTARYGLSLVEMAKLRDSILRQSLIIAALAILLSLVLLISSGYLLTRHLGYLLTGTHRLMEGHYATRLAVRTTDEIGLLTENFNRMAAVLARDVAERMRHQRELEFMAHHDPLTQLPNRVLLADRLKQALAHAQRAQRLLAIAYLDLDHFKPVNDALGHKAGDQLLVMVAQRLKEHTRADDTICRLGGDEFVLLLGDLATIDECTLTLNRLLGAIATPYLIEQRACQVTASVGLTVYPFDDADADALLRHADQAMYVAKHSGRNQYHLFDTAHDRQLQVQRSQRARIEAGLAHGEFVLFYQPKVDMRSGAVVGAEALIRWQHPDAGLLAPASFLHEVENSEFAIPLGEWVLDTALAQLAAWRRAGLSLGVSVNISPRHLQAPNFAARLGELLAQHPEAPAEALELEIVESAALEDVIRVAEAIAACRDLGVTFALDDFGTGYSSLSYFKRLHVDVLKIDQSFVRDLLTDDEDRAIVEGVISLTRTFRRQVIAEGVETAEIGVALLKMGCSIAQGYGIARPMPAADLPRWIAQWRPYPQWQC